jgi:rRNA maturation protein Rpf1
MIEEHNRQYNKDFPLVIITTSRRPLARIRTFSNDLSRLLPNSLRMTRGKQSLKEIAEKVILQGCTRLVVLERWRIDGCKISFYSIESRGLEPLSPKIYVSNFLTHLERKKKGSRIPTVHAIVLLSEEESAKRLSSFLSSFLMMRLMSWKDPEASSGPSMIISSNGEGKVRLSVRNRDSSDNIPSLSIQRIVWN